MPPESAEQPYRLFQYGLNTGGPGVMSVGWIIVSFFSAPALDLDIAGPFII